VPFLSALEVVYDDALYESTSTYFVQECQNIGAKHIIIYRLIDDFQLLLHVCVFFVSYLFVTSMS